MFYKSLYNSSHHEEMWNIHSDPVTRLLSQPIGLPFYYAEPFLLLAAIRLARFVLRLCGRAFAI